MEEGPYDDLCCELHDLADLIYEYPTRGQIANRLRELVPDIRDSNNWPRRKAP